MICLCLYGKECEYMIGNKIEPFKIWCQKVLPNVYDDSLSYYEYLCKMNEYLNEVIEQMNTLTEAEEEFQANLTSQWNTYKTTLSGEWLEYKTGLTAEWNEYKNDLTAQWTTTKYYIDNYFDNLNVQTEINNKLDAMVLDGTFNAIVEPIIGDDLSGYVTAWLNEHVDPVGSAVTVDSSLTISGSAADAKVTGDRITKNEIRAYDSALKSGSPVLVPTENILPYKVIDGTTQLPVDSQTTILFYNLNCKKGYMFHIYNYTGFKMFFKKFVNNQWVDLTGSWATNDYVLETDNIISVYVRRVDNGNLTEANVTNLINGFRVTNTNDAEFKCGVAKFDDSQFQFKKTLDGNGLLIDNDKSILIYPVSTIVNSIISISDYDTYKICYKTKNNDGTWGSASQWQDYDLHIGNSTSTIAVYIRRIDNADVTNDDLVYLKKICRYGADRSIKEEIDVIDDKIYDTDFVNNFIPSNLITLDASYNDFPINIKISRYEKIYGHNLTPKMFTKNHYARTTTYYISPNGNDSNDGLSITTPLKTIDVALNKSDIDTIILLEGDYYVGTHISADIATVVNIIGKGNVRIIAKVTQDNVKFTTGCYVENVIFYGGTTACTCQIGDNLMCFNRCTFENAYYTNGLSVLGGNYVLFNCKANNNAYDGFNYHSDNSNYKPQVVEIECCGYGNGKINDLTQHNGSTIHETGSRIIRIGCKYGYSKGGVVADADGASSINVSCTAFSTLATQATNRNGSFVAINTSKMWLYGCNSYGSPYDVISDASNVYETEAFRHESTVNSGTISVMN